MHRRESEAGARIMVVDDEPIVGDRLKDLLERDGHTVDVFTGGQAAVEALGRKEYDLVITDIKMEGVDGFAVLEAARAKVPSPGVIVITGVARKGYEKEALEGGAVEFIPKPFRFEEIRRAIERYMNHTVYTVS